MVRPVGALISAIVAGVLVSTFDREEPVIEEKSQSCGNCCTGEQQGTSQKVSLGQRFLNAVTYGYGRMIQDTAKWLAIGLVAATFITALVPQSFFLMWGDGLLAMLIMVIVGLPMYICATASTPVAASLLFAGISPGAALVFMLTGPATNIATMGVIKEQLGMRSLVAYLIGVIGTAIVCGLILNELYQMLNWSLQLEITEHGQSYPLWRQLAAIFLTSLVARVWLQPMLSDRQSANTPVEQP